MAHSSEHYVAQATSIASDVLAKHAADVDRQARWPAESLAALAQVGLHGLTVPATHGGAGQGPRTFTVRDLDAFTRTFDAALNAGDLSTIVAKVEAIGPVGYVTDLALLENRFEFQRWLRQH